MTTTVSTTWEVWLCEVVGNEKYGWEVHDRTCLNRCYHLDLPVHELCYPGQNLSRRHAAPSKEQVEEAITCGEYCDIDTDWHGTVITVYRARDGYPLGQLVCVSHESLSPLRLRGS